MSSYAALRWIKTKCSEGSPEWNEVNGFLCGIKNVPGHGLQGWVVGDGQDHFYGDRADGKKNAFAEWNEGVPERNDLLR